MGALCCNQTLDSSQVLDVVSSSSEIEPQAQEFAAELNAKREELFTLVKEQIAAELSRHLGHRKQMLKKALKECETAVRDYYEIQHLKRDIEMVLLYNKCLTADR